MKKLLQSIHQRFRTLFGRRSMNMNFSLQDVGPFRWVLSFPRLLVIINLKHLNDHEINKRTGGEAGWEGRLPSLPPDCLLCYIIRYLFCQLINSWCKSAGPKKRSELNKRKRRGRRCKTVKQPREISVQFPALLLSRFPSFPPLFIFDETTVHTQLFLSVRPSVDSLLFGLLW